MTEAEIQAEVAAKRAALKAQQGSPPVDPEQQALQAEVEAKRASGQIKGFGETVADMGKSFGSGLARGAVGAPGVVGDIGEGMKALHGWIQEKLWGLPENPEIAKGPNPFPTSDQLIQAVGQVGGKHAQEILGYQPQTQGGRYARTVGDFTGGMVMPGSVATRGAKTGTELAQTIGKEVLTQGIVPGLASEAAGQVAQQLGPGWETAARTVAGGTAAPLANAPRGPHLGSQVSDIDGRQVRTSAAAKMGEKVQDMAGIDPVTGQPMTGAERAAAEWNRVGPEGRPVDIGPGTTGLAEGLVATPGPQKQTLRDFVTVRDRSLRGQDSLLSKALDEHVEPKDKSFIDQSDTAKAARAKQADDLFGKAEADAAGKVISTDPVLRLIEGKLPTSVAADATRLLPQEQELLNLRGILENRTDFRSLKMAKERLDDIIAEKKAANQNPGDVIEIKNKLVDVLSDATRNAQGESSYRAALKAYRTDSQIMEAITDGQKVFDRQVRPDEFGREWSQMSPEQRTAFKMGARDGIATIMDAAPNDYVAGMSKLNSNYGREKLNIILGKEQTDALYARLEGITRQQGVKNKLSGGSQTAERTASQKEIPNPADPNVIAPPLALQPTPGQIAVGLTKKMYEKIANPLRSAEMKAHNQDLTGLLLAERPEAERAAFMQRLAEIYERGQERRLPFGGYAATGAESGYRADEDNRPPLFLRVQPRRKE